MAVKSSLEQHCRALADCRMCGHTTNVAPIVSIAAAPKVMLVGQAPGQVEAAGGKPFAGRAGKTLFRWLERAGIDEPTARAEIYIAAVTRCYPGPSPSGRGDRVPSPRERELCRPWLEAELSLIRPALIIPVGRLAIDYFLESKPLDRLVGELWPVEHVGGSSRALPLPHPSGASSWVNLPANRALLDRALARLVDEAAALGLGTRGTARRSA